MRENKTNFKGGKREHIKGQLTGEKRKKYYYFFFKSTTSTV